MFFDSKAILEWFGAVEASERFGVPLERHHVPIAKDGEYIASHSTESLQTVLSGYLLFQSWKEISVLYVSISL